MSRANIIEYRITKARTSHPDIRELVMTFSDADGMWNDWKPCAEDLAEANTDLSGLSGLLGIAETTAREEEAKGARDVRLERRRVEPWEQVDRRSIAP